MARTPRARSESDIYHAMNRGVGHCIIFEDDQDRREFLGILALKLKKYSAMLLAWCLMDNHYHLLLQVSYEDLPRLMHDVNLRYAQYFNRRYGRDGCLFGARFKSEPITSDEHFLTVLRYIHRNPEKAGIARTCEYRWSSYREYVKKPRLISSKLALSMLSGKKGFRSFHDIDDPACDCIDIHRDRGRQHFSDVEALEIARVVLPDCGIEKIAGLLRTQRDKALRALKAVRLSVRQIARFTGISKTVVARA